MLQLVSPENRFSNKIYPLLLIYNKRGNRGFALFNWDKDGEFPISLSLGSLPHKDLHIIIISFVR